MLRHLGQRGFNARSLPARLLPTARWASALVRDPHVVLGVEPGASQDELKAAYREKAMATHPDRHTAEDREVASEEFKEISEAFSQLARPTPGRPATLSGEEAERLFWDIFGPDGDVELAWRVPGRRAPRAPSNWQEYQSLLETGDHDVSSGSEARKLYRACLRAIRGVDDATATGVRDHARSLYETNAHETDVARIRALLVDGRHSLDELVKCLGTAGQ